MLIFNPNQAKMLKITLNDDVILMPKKRLYNGIKIIDGYGGGKTYGACLCMILFAIHYHANTSPRPNFAYICQTIKAGASRPRDYFKAIAKELGLTCIERDGGTKLEFDNFDIEFFGANESKDKDRIGGKTFAAMIIDEVQRLHYETLVESLSRTRQYPTFKWILGNKQSIRNRNTKELFIEKNDLKLVELKMPLNENTTVNEQIKDEIRGGQAHNPSLFKRNIENEYAELEGLIYPDPKFVSGPVGDFIHPERKILVGVDYGNSTVTCAIMIAQQLDKSKWVAVKEYYQDCHKEENRRTAEEHAREIVKMFGRYKPKIFVDPNATPLIDELKRHLKQGVKEAENDVELGLNHAGSLIQNGRLKFHDSLINTKQELETYIWNENEDKPLKKNDHLMDSMKYACLSGIKQFNRYQFTMEEG